MITAVFALFVSCKPVSSSAVKTLAKSNHNTIDKNEIEAHTAIQKPKVPDELDFLIQNQNADGSWGQVSPLTHTSLSLLAFLSSGNTHLSKKYGTAVAKCMQWLIAVPVSDTEKPLEQMLLLKSLSEAYTMTGISSLEEAMNFRLKKLTRNFKTLYKQAASDPLLLYFMCSALRAYYDTGLEVPEAEEHIYRLIVLFKKNASLTNADKISTELCAVIFSLQLFSEGHNPVSNKLYTRFEKDIPLFFNKKQSAIDLFLAQNAAFQNGGNIWTIWNRLIQKHLKVKQLADGSWPLEWPLSGLPSYQDYSKTDKQVATTALCTVNLAIYYRFLPPVGVNRNNNINGTYQKYAVSQWRLSSVKPLSTVAFACDCASYSNLRDIRMTALADIAQFVPTTPAIPTDHGLISHLEPFDRRKCSTTSAMKKYPNKARVNLLWEQKSVPVRGMANTACSS